MLILKQKVFTAGEVNSDGTVYTLEAALSFIENFKLDTCNGLKPLKAYLDGYTVMIEVEVDEGSDMGKMITGSLNTKGAISIGSKISKT